MLLILLETVLKTTASMICLGAIIWFALWKRVDDRRKILAIAVYPLLFILMSCLLNEAWTIQYREISAATAVIISGLYFLAWKKNLPPFPTFKK